MPDEPTRDLPNAAPIVKRGAVPFAVLLSGYALALVVAGALIAVILGQKYEFRWFAADREQQLEKVGILVAMKGLNRGDVLKSPDDLFEVKQVDKGDEPRNAVTDIEALKGKMLKRPLRPGDFVTPDDLRDATPKEWPTQMPHGLKAIGIRVDENVFGDKFAKLPNTRVDVILTSRRVGDGELNTRVLFDNVLVLAADVNMLHDDLGRAVTNHDVIVVLSPEDILRLESARTLGTISLVQSK